MDPVSFFSVEVCEQIFCQLCVADLKTCLIVSTSWNHLIESSVQCLKNVNLRIGHVFVTSRRDSYTIDDIKTVTRGRKYQKIGISCILESETEFLDLFLNVMKSNRRWKSVFFLHARFPSTSSFLKIVETFEETVEQIAFYSLEIMNRAKVTTNFKFQQLKSLVWYDFNTAIEDDNKMIFELFQNCSTLRSLRLGITHNPHPSVEFCSDFMRLFDQQNGLKELDCDRRSINLLFSVRGKSSFSCQLEDLTITDFPRSTQNDNEPFVNFLKTQKSIENFKIFDKIENINKILKVVLEMNPVKELTVLYFTEGAFVPETLPIRHSVEKLSIYTDIYIYNSHCFSVCTLGFAYVCREAKRELNREKIKYFLKLAPKATQIKIRFVDEEMAKFIAENFKDLQRCKPGIIMNEEAVKRILPQTEFTFNNHCEVLEKNKSIEKKFRNTVLNGKNI